MGRETVSFAKIGKKSWKIPVFPLLNITIRSYAHINADRLGPSLLLIGEERSVFRVFGLAAPK
jgi:hypothetical protein